MKNVRSKAGGTAYISFTALFLEYTFLETLFFQPHLLKGHEENVCNFYVNRFVSVIIQAVKQMVCLFSAPQTRGSAAFLFQYFITLVNKLYIN